MSSQTGWFIGGMIILALASLYQPKLAGLFVVLLVAYLGIRVAQKNLL